MKELLLANFLLILFFISTGCDDTSNIGTDLQDDDKFNLVHKDDFRFSGKVFRGDSIATFNINSDASTYLIGDIDESIFGQSSSEIYVKLLYNSSQLYPDLDSVTVDSVVLSFLYDTIGFYGNPTVMHNLELFEMKESLVDYDTIYSNKIFDTEETSFASRLIVPNPYDSVLVKDFDNDVIVKQRPQLRIKLDDAVATAMMNRLENVVSDSTLTEVFKGFKMKSTVDTKNSYFALNFSNTANFSSGVNGMKVYYTKVDPNTSEETKGFYNFLFSSITSNYFKQEYTNSLVGQGFTNPVLFDSLLFIQSQQGLKTELEISTDQISLLEGKLINFAELEITIADLPEDEPLLYEPTSFIVATEYSDDGKLEFIRDVNSSFSQFGNFITGFGGAISDNDGVSIYKCVVTSFLKEQIEKGEGFKLVLEAAGKTQTPKRTVLYGAKHSQYAPKLKVTYTDIN